MPWLAPPATSNGGQIAPDLVLLGENNLYYSFSGSKSRPHPGRTAENSHFLGGGQKSMRVQVLDIDGDGRDDLLLRSNWDSPELHFRFRLQNKAGGIGAGEFISGCHPSALYGRRP